MNDTTIFDQKILVLVFGPFKGPDIDVLSVEDLRHENRGYPALVRSILQAVTTGRIYDDSDPDAYLGKSDFVFYMPYIALTIGGIPLLTDVEEHLAQVEAEYDAYVAKREAKDWDGYGSEEAEGVDGYDQGYIAALENVLHRLSGGEWR